MFRLQTTRSACTIGLSLALGAGAAQADCKALIAALEKAEREERIAQYDVDAPNQPLNMAPLFVRIGKVGYTNTQDGKFDVRETGTANPMLAGLKRGVQDGKIQCEGAGSGAVRAATADKIRYTDPATGMRTGVTTVWIDRRSGLPAYHEFSKLGPGGIAWTYGDAVTAPVARR
jgi:hypothetical protein